LTTAARVSGRQVCAAAGDAINRFARTPIESRVAPSRLFADERFRRKTDTGYSSVAVVYGVIETMSPPRCQQDKDARRSKAARSTNSRSSYHRQTARSVTRILLATGAS